MTLSRPRPIATIALLTDDSGYTGRIVMDGVAHITGPFESLDELVGHVGELVGEKHRESAAEDPRAWVV